jgi:hypothetical protein
MESILLGAIAYSGLKNDPKNKKGANNTLYNKSTGKGCYGLSYNSDMENSIKKIELNQAKRDHSKPGYLNQFDELTFDTISDPVSMNQSDVTVTGVNSSLQRNLDFQRGYSDFQHSDMHYDVVDKANFTHNNMTLRTARRDFNVNADRSQRSLETFTGEFKDYTAKKEKVPLFQPMSDLTWVNGMPSVTSKLQNRYLPSNKNNNGDLPFEYNLRVKPGVGFKDQEGTYGVYRVDPRNVDELRSEINQKVSYKSMQLESGKKGEMRGPDPTLTKFKLPDFREQTVDDLVATRADISAPYQAGDFTNVTTQRNEKQDYKPGPATRTSMGDGPDLNKTKFSEAKKENYLK